MAGFMTDTSARCFIRSGSRHRIWTIRAEIGEANFAAQYQQRPLQPVGVLIKREWIRRM